jgi:hypothetical protein
MESPDTSQQEAKLSDALAEEFERMESEGEGETEEEVDESVSEEVDEEVASETDEEGEPEEAEEGEDEPLTEEETQEQEMAEAEDSGYTEPAPERWPNEIKEVYNSLPPEARKAMLEGIYKPMQASYTRTTQELAQERKRIEPVQEILEQYRNDFERMGVEPTEALRRQMAWASHFARVGSEQGLRDMAAAYGHDNTQVTGQQEEEYLTPMERAMKTRLDTLEQTFTQQQQSQAQQAEAQQQAMMQQRYNEVQQGLQDFISEQKDGKPAHPHIETVAPQISGLLRGGLIPASDEYGQPIPVRDQLATAYQMACNMNPALRTASGRSNQRQVARARSAESVGVVAKSPASQTSVREGSISDDLSATFDSLSRRVG